jgi:hypothetical protein
VYDWAKEMIGEPHVIHFDLIDDQEVIGSAHRWRTKSYVQVSTAPHFTLNVAVMEHQ